MGGLAKAYSVMKPQVVQPDPFNIGDLSSKLEQHVDEEEEAERKKQEFEDQRKKHYKNEFNMAALLKQGAMDDDEDEDEGEDK